MRRLGRVGLLGVVLTLCALASVGSATAAGHVPVVAPGHTFTVRVGGFAGHRAVRVQLVGRTSGRTTVRTDGHGRARVSYRAPVTRGRYRLLVSGPARGTPGHRPAPPTGGRGDVQVVAVTVPLVIGVPFQVGPAGGSGTLGSGVHHGGGAGSGGLADTGSDLQTPLLLAAALCTLGIAATLAGRRRARPRVDRA